MRSLRLRKSLPLLAAFIVGPFAEMAMAGTRPETPVQIERLLALAPNRYLAAYRSVSLRLFDEKRFLDKIFVDASSQLSAEDQLQLRRRVLALFQQRVESMLRQAPPDLRCHVRSKSTAHDVESVHIGCKTGGAQYEATVERINGRITDLSFNGALLSRNYRAFVNRQLRKSGGAAGLMARLEGFR